MDSLLTSSVLSAYWAYESDRRVLEPSHEPLWLLGVKYDTRTDLEAVRQDILSRVWVTYRCGFPALADERTTSDTGWGCMLRVGQMMLAEAGLRRHLGRGWRWSSDCRDALYLKVLSMFEDQNEAPFSLHVMTSVGRMQGKSIGEWYGANTVAHLIRRLPEFDVWNNYVVSVNNDNHLYTDETRQLSKKAHPNGWNPLLVLFPCRLGMDQFNPMYTPQFKRFFTMPLSLGVLGGTPSHALYLIGYVGDEVLFLDPHTTQECSAVGNKVTEEEEQADCKYHCTTTPHMPIERLDPSMTLCFLCNSEPELSDLIAWITTNFSGEDDGTSPLVTVLDTRPAYADFGLSDSMDDSDVTVALKVSNPQLNPDSEEGSNLTKCENAAVVSKSAKTSGIKSGEPVPEGPYDVSIGMPAHVSDRNEEEADEQSRQSDDGDSFEFL